MSGNSSPSWQSTLIALALIALVGFIFLRVYDNDGIDGALKVWAALGTLVGVVTGAVPTYFFGRNQTESLRQTAETVKDQVNVERERRDKAEDKLAIVLGHAPEAVIDKAKASRPDLF